MISVIIPTYNREKTILRAVDSVLNQSYQDFELIIVDDGSKDNTKAIIEHLADARIQYIWQENGGAAAARNTGILMAKGEYIAFQDSDDYWYPDKLEKQLATLLKSQADVVFCKLMRHNYSTAQDSVWPALEEGFVDYELLLKFPSVSTQTLFGKSDVFKNNLFDIQLPALEDYAFSIVAAKKFKFYHMGEVLVDLYLQADSLTSDKKKYIIGNQRIIERYPEIWAEHPEIQAHRLYVIGCLKASIGENDSLSFRESWKLQKQVKTFVKMVLSKIHILAHLSRKD